MTIYIFPEIPCDEVFIKLFDISEDDLVGIANNKKYVTRKHDTVCTSSNTVEHDTWC